MRVEREFRDFSGFFLIFFDLLLIFFDFACIEAKAPL